MTCWRRLRNWNNAGVWQRLYEILLAELRAAGMLELSWAGGRLRPRPGAQGRPNAGQSSVDPGRLGSEHHLVTDAGGVPLTVLLTGGNGNDFTQLIPQL